MEARDGLLEALHLATERGLVHWQILRDDNRDPNQDRDIFSAEVAGESVEIELVYFQVAAQEASERVLARFSGLGCYFHVPVGTRSYELILDTLSHNIPGWEEGRAGSASALRRATARVRRVIAQNPA